MQLDKFINSLPCRELNEKQIFNVEKIKNLSPTFHKDAGIPFPEKEIDSRSIVLESGHQPNYLPYPGTYKKAFLLDFLRKKTDNSIALFGFADYNLCTAPILYSNKIPALTKDGCVKVEDLQ